MQRSPDEPGSINIALRVRTATIPNWYSVHIVGEVLYPLSMAGRVVEVRYHETRNAYLHHQLQDIKRSGFPDVDGIAEQIEARRENVTEGLKVFAKRDAIAFFYSCEKVENSGGAGYWRSRRTEFVEGEGHRAVMSGMCRVTMKQGQGAGARDKVHVDILQLEEAKIIKNDEDLRLFFAEYMAPVRGGLENNANCAFRLIAPKMQPAQVMICWVYAAREWATVAGRRGAPDKKFSVPASVQKTWEDAIYEGTQSNGMPRVIGAALGVRVGEMSKEHQDLAASLAKDLASGDILIEAIPGQRIRVITRDTVDASRGGLATRSNIAFAIKSCTFQGEQRFVPMCGIVQVGGAQNNDPSRGMSVTMLKLIPDRAYTHYSTKDMPTKNYLGASGVAVLNSGEEYSGRAKPGSKYFYADRENE